MVDYTEPIKGTVNWTEPVKPNAPAYINPQMIEMTFRMMGDLTFIELGEQTFDKWLCKFPAPIYTEPLKPNAPAYYKPPKGQPVYTEPSKF